MDTTAEVSFIANLAKFLQQYLNGDNGAIQAIRNEVRRHAELSFLDNDRWLVKLVDAQDPLTIEESELALREANELWPGLLKSSGTSLDHHTLHLLSRALVMGKDDVRLAYGELRQFFSFFSVLNKGQITRESTPREMIDFVKVVEFHVYEVAGITSTKTAAMIQSKKASTLAIVVIKFLQHIIKALESASTILKEQGKPCVDMPDSVRKGTLDMPIEKAVKGLMATHLDTEAAFYLDCIWRHIADEYKATVVEPVIAPLRAVIYEIRCFNIDDDHSKTEEAEEA